jgi:DMSO/TMAO reductase YedYZ molybdopterin-dependent catalytic subunit
MEPSTPSPSARPGIVRSIVTGVVAGAAALGAGELVGGLRSSWQSPVVGVAEATIDHVPRSVKDFGIRTFGEDDKVALVIGILVFSVIFAAVLGLAARRSIRVAAAGFAAFAAVGVWASQQLVGSGASAVLPSVIAGLAGVVALQRLHRASGAARPVEVVVIADGGDTSVDGAHTGAGTTNTAWFGDGGSRRRFLASSGLVAAVAVAAAAGGRALRGRFSASSSRDGVVLPSADRPRAAAPVSVQADGIGVSPFYTPNAGFYRVDTALAVPQVTAESWSLRVTGMVDREVEISYAELLDRSLAEEDITLTCVSNTVGGDLLGTARWLGLPIQSLLDEAGVQADADQLVGRSVDGYTCGFPLASLDGRPALIAVGMNGEPLPISHGFPARLIVSGLYGYVSATKWVTELEVTRFDRFDQYWVARGWDQEAPIKTSARIDTPRTLAKLAPGRIVIGGVAWAQTRGISKVEVAIDGDEFREATLADELNEHTWRQWTLPWDATPGRHRITVRATDGDGVLQIEDRAEPFPNGASGWMSIFVDVTDAA